MIWFWLVPLVVLCILVYNFPEGESIKEDLETMSKFDFFVFLLFLLIPLLNIFFMFAAIRQILKVKGFWDRWENWWSSPVLKKREEDE